MELIDFEFKRERKLGEFVQDFIQLLKLIIGHFFSIMVKLLFAPICIMIWAVYYISTKYTLSTEFTGDLLFDVIIVILVLFLTGLFAFGLAIEYFLLIRNLRSVSFSEKEVWRNFKANMVLYFRFFLASIVVSLIAIIPIGLITLLSVFIPFVGSIGLGIFYGMVGLWFFCAFLLYREGYDDLTDCFTSAYAVLKKRFFEYGVASYVVNFLFQSLLTLIILIPSLIVGLIAYNSLDFNTDFFDTFYGRMLASLGGSMLTLFGIVYAMLSVLSYGIIYETAKELRYGEDIFEKISKIGRKVHA